jgi:glutathione peroxidase
MAEIHPLTPEAAAPWSFPAIRGGDIASADVAGRAVLLVNTASLCGYTHQYGGMQALHDRYKDRGLVVLAVPSDDFKQEKPSDGEVAAFCEANFGLTLPMTAISRVTGPEAHPLYQWLQETAGFIPEWNFNKVLFDRQGRVAATFGSEDEPLGGEIEQAVERVLAAG